MTANCYEGAQVAENLSPILHNKKVRPITDDFEKCFPLTGGGGTYTLINAFGRKLQSMTSKEVLLPITIPTNEVLELQH